MDTLTDLHGPCCILMYPNRPTLEVMKRVESVSASEGEARFVLKSEITALIEALSAECEAAIVSIADDGVGLRQETVQLWIKHDEDTRGLEQRLDRGIEMVHTDCQEAVDALKTTHAEGEMRVADRMLLHEENR